KDYDIEFNDERLSFKSLLDRMKNHPTQDEIRLLAKELFKTERDRRQAINKFIRKSNLTKTSVISLTGAFDIKERQCFTVMDLLKIYRDYPYILDDSQSFVFGDKYTFGFRPFANHIRVFIEEIK